MPGPRLLKKSVEEAVEMSIESREYTADIHVISIEINDIIMAVVLLMFM